VLDEPDYIVGAGSDAQVQLGALLVQRDQRPSDVFEAGSSLQVVTSEAVSDP